MRTTQGFLDYWLCLREGQDPSNVFSRCLNEDGPLIKELSVWVREKQATKNALKPLLSDQFMAAFQFATGVSASSKLIAGARLGKAGKRLKGWLAQCMQVMW